MCVVAHVLTKPTNYRPSIKSCSTTLNRNQDENTFSGKFRIKRSLYKMRTFATTSSIKFIATATSETAAGVQLSDFLFDVTRLCINFFRIRNKSKFQNELYTQSLIATHTAFKITPDVNINCFSWLSVIVSQYELKIFTQSIRR